MTFPKNPKLKDSKSHLWAAETLMESVQQGWGSHPVQTKHLSNERYPSYHCEANFVPTFPQLSVTKASWIIENSFSPRDFCPADHKCLSFSSKVNFAARHSSARKNFPPLCKSYVKGILCFAWVLKQQHFLTDKLPATCTNSWEHPTLSDFRKWREKF